MASPRLAMGRIAKFLRLSAGERWLLWKAWWLLLTVRLALWLLPFARVRRWLARRSEATPRRCRNRPPAGRVAWAVVAASRLVPGGGNCLLRALVAQCLLQRRGYETRIHFGVAHPIEPDLKAHAWLECEGEVVVGGDDLDQFTPLRPSESSFR